MQHSRWIKDLTIEVAEVVEDSDESADEEFEARLAEHMKILNHPGRINYVDEQLRLQRRITQEDTRIKWVENNVPVRHGNTEQTKNLKQDLLNI